MLEIFEGLARGFMILLRLFVEGGLIDVSLSATGRFFIRLCYPPHWLKPASYPIAAERWVGLLVWVAFAYGIYAADTGFSHFK